MLVSPRYTAYSRHVIRNTFWRSQYRNGRLRVSFGLRPSDSSASIWPHRPLRIAASISDGNVTAVTTPDSHNAIFSTPIALPLFLGDVNLGFDGGGRTMAFQ
jgi:hypothetical protein